MNQRAEFQRVKKEGRSKVGKFLILSTLPDPSLAECKFAFVTSKKVGKAHQRNLVRRRFRDLISRHGGRFTDSRYLVMIGRYSTPKADFSKLEEEFLKLGEKLELFS